MPALAVGWIAAEGAFALGASALTAVVGGLAVASVVDQRSRDKRVEGKQDKLNKLEQARSVDSAVRERRNQIRQQRVASARIENTATQTGQQSSTAATYGMGGVQSQVNNNIGQVNTALAFGNASSELKQDIFNLQQPSNLQYATNLAQVAGSIFEPPKIKTDKPQWQTLMHKP